MFAVNRCLVLIAFLLPAILVAAPQAQGVSGWHTNYSTAQAQAAAEKKLLLVNFSGSDWCGWCIKLQKEVFVKREFIDYARSNLVLLTVDFPKRKLLPPSQSSANQALAARFGVEGFPTLLVLNVDGTRLGTLGFAEGGPKTFIRELEKIVARRASQPVQPDSETRQTTTPKSPRGGLQLLAIVAKKGYRSARINDSTLTTGQSARVRVASGEVGIRCVEIRDTSVIVKVDGRKEPLELKLSQRL